MRKIKLSAIFLLVSVVSLAGCNKDKSVVKTFTVNVITANGTVEKSPNLSTYNDGAQVQLTAKPNPDFKFTSWSGDITSPANPLTVIMNGDKNITANFNQIVKAFTLTVTAINGTVANMPALAVYANGASVQLTATPNSGYTFTSWGGDATGSTNPVTVFMDAEKNIIANFTALPATIDVKSTGAKGDGVTDDTGAIQNAIAQIAGTGGTVLISSGTYMINTGAINDYAGRRGLQLKSNMTLKLASDAILKAIPNSGGVGGTVVDLLSADKVDITGGTIIGDRANPAPNESGDCIAVRASHNVTVKNITLKDAHDDGIIIAYESSNVTLDGVVSDNNRRQGLSIVSVVGAVIKNSVFKNTIGTAPQCGIDVEPNKGEVVNDVLIQNCEFFGNKNHGLVLQAMNGVVSNVIVDKCSSHNNVSCGLVAYRILSASKNSFTNNTANNNGNSGILLGNSSADVSVNGNICNNNGNFGILINNSATGNTDTGNTATGNTNGQIVDQVGGNTIK
ncbi:MAG: right-handed parallel beta-helix repeat-containing protein [Prolixibacteraceae bacterium]|jgi:parallel beta-helix repeat protein|nr:right-handed parallel beta-helix repeat-containing protein [Prolixibacteraceae bacterium]